MELKLAESGERIWKKRASAQVWNFGLDSQFRIQFQLELIPLGTGYALFLKE